MILSKKKEFNILVKIDRNFPKADSNMNLLALEIHEVENELVLEENEALTLVKKLRSQRTKNVKPKHAEQDVVEKMKVIATVKPHGENIITLIGSEIQPTKRT